MRHTPGITLHMYFFGQKPNHCSIQGLPLEKLSNISMIKKADPEVDLDNNRENTSFTMCMYQRGWEEGPGRSRQSFHEEKASRGFEPRSLDSESRVLTVTP